MSPAQNREGNRLNREVLVQSLPKELTARRNGKIYTVNTAQIGRSSTTAAPKEFSGSTEAVSVATLFESKATAEDANNQVDDRELSYSIELGQEETDLLEQKTEITSSSFAVSESPPAGTIAGTEENGLFTLVQSSQNDEGELHLSQDCAQSTEDLDQICMKFCKYAGEMKDNYLETALQALASCIPLEQFVDFITDSQVEEVWQALAKRLLPDRIAKYLSQAQIEGIWQEIAPQIPAKSLSFYDWSTSELENFAQKARWELKQQKQESPTITAMLTFPDKT